MRSPPASGMKRCNFFRLQTYLLSLFLVPVPYDFYVACPISHLYLSWVTAHLAKCLKCESGSSCFKPGEGPSIGAFSVIVKTNCETDGSFTAPRNVAVGNWSSASRRLLTMRPSQQPDLRMFSEMSSSWLKGFMQIFPGARPLPPPRIELNLYLYKNVGKQNFWRCQVLVADLPGVICADTAATHNCKY